MSNLASFFYQLLTHGFDDLYTQLVNQIDKDGRLNYFDSKYIFLDDSEHSNIHLLKTINSHFDNFDRDYKTFEIRKNDRDFKVGNILCLAEYIDGIYTGDYVWRLVTHILTHEDFPDGIKEDYCVLSIKRIVFDF